MERIEFRYGRLLSDFVVGETWEHPWELTLDSGLTALWAASFQDATPLYSSSLRARELGLLARPIHPLLCLNLALSFSVHDVSEQAIAHLAYVDVRFPEPAYAGETVRACSTVLDVKPASSGDRGVVHVRTVLSADGEKTVCAFERKALVRGGSLSARPAAARGHSATETLSLPHTRRMPEGLGSRAKLNGWPALHGAYEDFKPGQVYAHAIGRTVGESEHMQLTTLVRNSHPLHFDALYAKEGGSFTGARVVYGGLVFAWVAALASRDLAGHALWDLGWQAGAHPSPVAAGDTLYAISRVLAVEEAPGLRAGQVKLGLVGVRNMTSQNALDRYGESLFAPELGKKEGRIAEKVFEIERTLLVAKRA